MIPPSFDVGPATPVFPPPIGLKADHDAVRLGGVSSLSWKLVVKAVMMMMLMFMIVMKVHREREREID